MSKTESKKVEPKKETSNKEKIDLSLFKVVKNKGFVSIINKKTSAKRNFLEAIYNNNFEVITKKK